VDPTSIEVPRIISVRIGCFLMSSAVMVALEKFSATRITFSVECAQVHQGASPTTDEH
jgi:hypothetical protein